MPKRRRTHLSLLAQRAVVAGCRRRIGGGTGVNPYASAGVRMVGVEGFGLRIGGTMIDIGSNPPGVDRKPGAMALARDMGPRADEGRGGLVHHVDARRGTDTDAAGRDHADDLIDVG